MQDRLIKTINAKLLATVVPRSEENVGIEIKELTRINAQLTILRRKRKELLFDQRKALNV